MKLSFETLGWRNISFEEANALARELGFRGVSYAYSSGADGLPDDNLMSERCLRLIRSLDEAELKVPCLTPDCVLPEGDHALVISAIRLAGTLSIPYVELVFDKRADLSDEDVAQTVRALLPTAIKHNVVLLIKTSGVYADTARLRALLDGFADDHLAALWDTEDPFLNGESADQIIEHLGAYVKHVHIRDYTLADGLPQPCLTGEGEVPLASVIAALRSIDYSGFLSLAWPFDDPNAMGADVVLPYYVNYMDRYVADQADRRGLYTNRTGTGQFIWKKEELIPLTFSEVLDQVTETFPDQYAFRFTTLDYTRTYSEFREDVDRFARSLIALGVKAGDHVAIWATNVPQWYVAFWATVKLGAVLVTVNTAYKIHEAEYLLRQSDTHTLIMIDGYREVSYVDIIRQLCPELESSSPHEPLRCKRLPFLRRIINAMSKQPGCLTWDEALGYCSKVPVEEVRRRAALVRPDDVCNMQYTSGTTGFPKGVMLTHRNIVNNGKCIGDRMDLSTADRMMIQVPMFHCFGMVLAMTAGITHASTLSPLPYFSAKPALTCVKQERITCFHGVPTMFIAMLEHPDFNPNDFAYVRTGIMAGSPCPVPVMRDVLDKMHMTEITIVYGQTEASPGCTMSNATDSLDVRVSTVGSPLPKIECRIVDPETNVELPDDMNGEFVVRGYNIMKGYYKMPKATESVIDKDGWLHTGDLACRQLDGNYRITGRLKDMIIRGGENVYPKEIEEFIYMHPKVQDVQVIGVPDAVLGEEIMACVIPKAGEAPTEQEIKDYVYASMSKHKVPRYVIFLDSFPMNAAGKILKYKMREDYGALANAPTPQSTK